MPRNDFKYGCEKEEGGIFPAYRVACADILCSWADILMKDTGLQLS